jgi:hypothetical protein
MYVSSVAHKQYCVVLWAYVGGRWHFIATIYSSSCSSYVLKTFTASNVVPMKSASVVLYKVR